MTEFRVLQLATSPRSFFTQQVTALEARGVECTTVTVPRPTGEGESGRSPREYARFYADVLHEGFGSYDLVHANYGLVGPVALAQPTRPVVLTLWGSDVMGPAWLRRVTVAAARRSDAVIAPSRPLARELPVPHHYIPFGVDTDLFRPIDRAASRERVGWDPDARIVLFPYETDRAVKNYDLAARVVEGVRAGSNAEVGGNRGNGESDRGDGGDGSDGGGVDVELKAVSGVAYEEMPYYMNASDALLVTSTRESGPMVVREAAACNVPVVSTSVGFVPDVLAGVENSVVADSEADLVAGLESVLASDGRSNGRAVVTGLGVDEMADRLLAVYRGVC
ncbi:glycosyltransferase [Halegenticoccus tardaugens]|uniref:glycosyltransferase n=1 Tax=Halegenticoccus tardaugens TaxID=2071624 RepID=UPI00100B4CDD|nr:glycosyltransferase [Halegenticoccus tardaugens]